MEKVDCSRHANVKRLYGALSNISRFQRTLGNIENGIPRTLDQAPSMTGILSTNELPRGSAPLYGPGWI